MAVTPVNSYPVVPFKIQQYRCHVCKFAPSERMYGHVVVNVIFWDAGIVVRVDMG